MGDTNVVSDVTNSIVRLAIVTVVIILVFRSWGLITRAIRKLEKAVQDPKEEEPADPVEMDLRHVQEAVECKGGDKEQCIKDALLHPIKFQFTMNSRDLQHVPLEIAVQDSKVDLGRSGDDFWFSRNSDTNKDDSA